MNINQAIEKFISTRKNPKTSATYSDGLRHFRAVLKDHRINPDTAALDRLREHHIVWLAEYLQDKDYAIRTEAVWVRTVIGFYRWVELHYEIGLNLERVRDMAKDATRTNGGKRINVDLEAHAAVLDSLTGNDIIELRDRAFLFLLATTGLRLSEALALTVGEIDSQMTITGKRDRERTVRIYEPTLSHLQDYIEARQAGPEDYLFVRHDDPRLRNTKPLTQMGARIIVNRYKPEDIRMTPHSYRHFAISTVLRKTKSVKIAQEFAGHASAQTTLDAYAHLLDNEMDDALRAVFEGDQP